MADDALPTTFARWVAEREQKGWPPLRAAEAAWVAAFAAGVAAERERAVEPLERLAKMAAGMPSLNPQGVAAAILDVVAEIRDAGGTDAR